jgi:DNA-binding HxlR family transcriptional regulator
MQQSRYIPDVTIGSEQIPVGTCSLAKTLGTLGDRWTLLILREAFYGVRRFDAIHRDLGVPRTVLSERLVKLVQAGLLEKLPYQEVGKRTRHEYRLTGKGADLFPALIALMEWGDRHMSAAPRPPLVLRHVRTGERVNVALVSEDGRVVTALDQLKADIHHQAAWAG